MLCCYYILKRIFTPGTVFWKCDRLNKTICYGGLLSVNIRGIPVIPYEPYMGWYNSKQVDELRKKITAVNSNGEQMRNICVRLSSQ